MPILKLAARLDLDGSGFQKGLEKAKGQASQFSGALKSRLAALFSVTVITSYIKSVLDAVGRIKDLSDQMSITTDDAQDLDFVFKQNGVSLEQFASAIGKFEEARRDAGEGNSQLIETFRKFGITQDDINDGARSTVDLIRQLSSALNEMEIDPKVVSSFRELFGVKNSRFFDSIKSLSTTKPPSPVSKEELDRIDNAVKLIEKYVLTLKNMATIKIAEILENPIQHMLDPFKGQRFFFDKTMTAIVETKKAFESFFNFMRTPLDFDVPFSENIDRLKQSIAAPWKKKNELAGPPLPPDYQKRKDELDKAAQGVASKKLFENKAALAAETELANALTTLYQSQQKLAFDQLDASEQRLEIERKVSNLRVQENEVEGEIVRARMRAAKAEQENNPSEAKRIMDASMSDQLELAKIQQQIVDAEGDMFRLKDPASKALSGLGFKPASDSLAKIGGFIDGAVQKKDLQPEMLAQLKRLNDAVTSKGIKLAGRL